MIVSQVAPTHSAAPQSPIPIEPILENMESAHSSQPPTVSLVEFLAPFRSDPSELVHLRVIVPKKAPPHLVRDYPNQTAPPNSRNSVAAYPNLTPQKEYLKTLREENKRRGIYYVVNPGGPADLDINRYVATFSETDPPEGRDIDAFLVRELSITPPLPYSALIQTYKSLHRYWLIDGECSREQWLLLQQGQIALYHSDATIMNESRVMRLPRFNHVRVDFVNDRLLYKPIELLEFNPENKYSVAELMAAFPVGPEGMKKAFEKLSRPDYKAAGIEPSDDLRKAVEALKKQPKSTNGNGNGKASQARDYSTDKITTLAEILERQRAGEALNMLEIQPGDYSDGEFAPEDIQAIESTINRISLQLANARQGTKADTLFHCGLILYSLTKGQLADEDRITSTLLESIALAGQHDPTFDPSLAAQIARDAYNKAHGTTIEELRGRDRAPARTPRTAANPPTDEQSGKSDAKTETDNAAQWPETLKEIAYQGLAGDIVRAIAPHTEADPVAILTQFLVTFGSVAGRNPYFRVEATHHHTNENIVLVGNTAKGRKGTSFDQNIRRFIDVDEHWCAHCLGAGLSSGEGLIWQVRDQIEKQEMIKEKGRVTGYQTVIADPGVSDKRLMVVEAEFANVLKVAARETNTLSPVVRLAWDSGNLRSMTKNSPARATDAHISIIGHVTRDELLRHLSTTEAANGFANRHLYFCVRRSKLLPEGGNLHTVDFSDITSRLRAAVTHARKQQELKRDDEARALWIEVYPQLSAEKSGMAGAITARAEAHAVRLSLIYALLDCSSEIKKKHLEAALEIIRYADESVRFLFGDSLGDPIADQILSALEESADTGMTREEIRKLLQGNVSSAAISLALNTLATNAKAYSIREKKNPKGRPAERWFSGTQVT
jgi:hypothetical protein